MSEALNVLKELLEDYGIDNADEIISEATDITNSYNPLDSNKGFKISAEDWLNKRGFDTKLNSNYSQYLVFQPRYNEQQQLISFQLYNGVKQNDTFRYLDKLNSFDVNSDTNVIRKDNFKRAIDSAFIKNHNNYGVSFDSHKTSYTIGNLIDQQFMSEDVVRNNIFKFNNPANIEYAKNKILKENTQITKVKTYESFRALTNINEVQTLLPESGVLTDSLLADNSYSFYDSLLRDNAPVSRYKDKLINDLKDIKTPKTQYLQQHFDEYFSKALTNQVNLINFNEESAQVELNNLITFDADYIKKFKRNDFDIQKAKQDLLKDYGLDKFVAEQSKKLNMSTVNNVNRNQDYNINLKAYEFFKNQQAQEKISGEYLNRHFGVMTFTKGKMYSIQQLQELSNETQDTTLLKPFKNNFRIKDNQVLFDFVDFKDNKIIRNTLNLGISKNEFERYLHLDYRSKGDVLLDSLIKSKLNTNDIISTLQSVNEDISKVQSGNKIDYSQLTSKYSQLTKEQFQYVKKAISDGNQLMINNIVSRSQTMIQGNSNKINHSIQGSLAAFNKIGARPWQSLESLNDVVIQFDSTDKSNLKYFNLNKMLSEAKANQVDYIVRQGELVNQNLNQLGKAEAVFDKQLNDFSLRDSNKALFFDSYGILEDGKLKHGQLAYNESMYLTKGFANTVFGANNRNTSLSLEDLNRVLGTEFNVNNKQEVFEALKHYTGQFDYQKKLTLFNTMQLDRNKNFSFDHKMKILRKVEELGLDQSEYNKFFRTHDGKNWNYDVDLIESSVAELNKTKFKSIGGFNFDSIFLMKNLNIDSKTGMVHINFDDVSSIKAGTKVHMNDGFKGTVSGIMNSIRVNGKTIAGMNASKAMNRSFDGGSLYSTIETSLFLANRQGSIADTNKYIKSLRSLNYNGKQFDLFDVLNLDFNFDSNNKSFSIFDKNAGINNYLEDLTNADLINNPHLRSKIETAKTIENLKALGISSFKQLDMIVNEQYEKHYSKGQKIYDTFDVSINNQTYKMMGKLNLKNLNITGANQVTPLKEALKLDMMTSRFFDAKGFETIGNNIRRQINNNYFNTINKFGPAINQNSLRIFNGQNTKKTWSQLKEIDFDVDKLLQHQDDIYSILYEDASFEDLINLNINDGRGKNLKHILDSYLDEMVDTKNRPFPIYKYSGSAYKETVGVLSKTFFDDLDLISDKDLGNEIKDYYYNLKSALHNKDVDLIKEIQKNNKSVIESLKRYKSKNSGAHFINRIISELNETNNLEELANMYNVIESPDKAINYNTMYNGVFKDPQTNTVNYAQIKSVLRNAMELKSVNVHNKVSDLFKSNVYQNINLRTNDDFLRSVERIKNTKLNNYTSTDIKFFELLHKTINNKEDRTVQDYFALINKNAHDNTISKNQINKLNYSTQELINETIHKFENYNSVKIVNENIVKDFNRNIDLHKASIFTKMFGADKFMRENLTKKKTMITNNLSINLTNSISQQVAESSNILKFISNEVANTDLTKPFSNSKIYQDVEDLFGKDFTRNVIFKDYKKDTIIDKTKLKKLAQQVEDIESVTFVNMNNLKKMSNDVFNNINDKLKNKKGFFGFLVRGPLQSSENIVPSYNIAYDQDNKHNSIIKELVNNGYDRGSIFSIVGKGTAARMKADNDGDKLYLAMINELGGNHKKNNASIEASVYYANEVSEDVINQKFGKTLNKSQLSKFKKYYSYYNQINKMRTQENIDSHYNIGQELFTNKKLREQYLKIGTTGNDNQKTLNYLSNELKNKDRDFNKTKSALQSFIGLDEQGHLINKLKNPFDFLNVTGEYFKDTNIAKTGIVYTKLNQVRNTTDIISKLTINKTTLDSLAKAVSNGNEKEYELVKQNIQEYLEKNNLSMKDLRDLVDRTRNNNLKTSMLTFEAIELGVISGKHGTKTIFEELEKLTDNINSNKRSVVLDYFKSMNVDKKNVDSIKNARQILKKVITASADYNNPTSEIDTNIINILKTSLSSKMYQLNNFSEVLDSEDLQAKLNAVDELSKEQIKKIMISTGMISDYADNLENINSVSKFIQSSLTGTKLLRNKLYKYKNNSLGFLGKVLGVDINKTTLEGRDINFDENLSELSENILNHHSVDQQQMLSDKDILQLKGIAKQRDEVPVFKPTERKINRASMQENIYPEQKVEPSISKNMQKKIKRIIKQSQRKTERIKVTEERASKATRETAERLNKFKLTKTKLGLGALLLGAFLGYTTGRSDSSTTQEQSKDEELGLGTNQTSYNQQKQNNLGYYRGD